MRNRKSLTYMIGGSLTIIAIVAAIVIAYLMSPANVYARHIAAAEKYLETGDYSRAILAYRDAIEQDPDNAEAYAALAEVYIRQNDMGNASDLLKIGVARTGSARLRLMLNMMIKDESSDNEVAVRLATQEAVLLDTKTLEVVGTYTFADYAARYGLENKKGNKDGSVTCTFKGLNAELTFSNTDKQPNVVSATTVTANAIPTNVMFTNVLNLFGASDYITYQMLETLNLSKLHIIDHPTWNKAVQFEEKNVRVTIQSDENGNISSGAANEFLPLKSEDFNAEDRKLVFTSGMIKDAQTGRGVSNAHLYVRENTYQTGPTVEEVYTDANGNYEFSLDPGEYTIEITADGYETSFTTIYIGSYETAHIENPVITKTVADGEVRIVLTWNSTIDLDSYLDGSSDDGTHIWMMWLSPTAGSKANLDLDDKDGFGPETTTIFDLNGVYRFHVFDYWGTKTIASSGAVVTVYLPDQSPVVIPINTSISGDTWCVFELDHGVLNIVNDGNVWGYGTRQMSK